MSNFAEARDLDELEGSLLPVAHAVPASEPGGLLLDDASAVPVTAATPVSYYAYDDVPAEEMMSATEQIREAPAVPLADGIEPEEEHLRLIARGARTGLVDNDAQKEDIRKANRQVHAINYFTDRQVEEANRRARWLSREENQQGWRGPKSELHMAPKASPSSDRGNEPKQKTGTFGKEYDVGQYDTKEYDTSDYQISEYKSVYDS